MSDTTFLSWPKGAIPASYKATDWQERLERRPEDYGLREGRCVPSSYLFLDLERDAEYMLSLSTF